MSLSSSRLTGEQIRAARALARIDQTELAKRTSLSLETIKRLERIRGPVDGNIRTINAIIEAFDALDIRFDSSDDGGVGVGKRGTGAPGAARSSWLTGREPTTPLHRLIYFSTAAAGSGADWRALLDDIAAASSRQNAACGVSGVLLAAGGRFLQVLEGSREAVMQIYGAISTDTRHHDLRIIETRIVASRQFQDWSLCCGLFASDREFREGMPSVDKGFHPEGLSPAAALGLLRLAHNLQLVDPRRRRDNIISCPLQVHCQDRACVEGDRAPILHYA